MPELVTCPSCGCGILDCGVRLGRRMHCISCGQTFVAGTPTPVPEPTLYPLQPEGEDEAKVPAVRVREVASIRGRQPLCPRCHRPVGWSEEICSHCGHLFDTRDATDPGGWQPRRDAVPHRGELIERLGGLALLGGAFALCTGPLGFLVALGCGIPAWWMARSDLAGMGAGGIDSSGRLAVEYGRNKASAGMTLALVSGLFWILAFIGLST